MSGLIENDAAYHPVVLRILGIVEDRFGGNLAAFCRATGVRRGAIQHWTDRQRSVPNAAAVRGIAASLGVNADWLLTGNGHPDIPNSFGVSFRALPLFFVNTLANAPPDVAFATKYAKEKFFADGVVEMSGKSFALRVTGEEMSPEILPSDVALCDPLMDTGDGRFVVFRDPPAGVYGIGRLKIEGNRRWIARTNREYPPVPVGGDGGAEVVARVFQIIRDV